MPPPAAWTTVATTPGSGAQCARSKPASVRPRRVWRDASSQALFQLDDCDLVAQSEPSDLMTFAVFRSDHLRRDQQADPRRSQSLRLNGVFHTTGKHVDVSQRRMLRDSCDLSCGPNVVGASNVLLVRSSDAMTAPPALP